MKSILIVTLMTSCSLGLAAVAWAGSPQVATRIDSPQVDSPQSDASQLGSQIVRADVTPDDTTDHLNQLADQINQNMSAERQNRMGAARSIGRIIPEGMVIRGGKMGGLQVGGSF